MINDNITKSQDMKKIVLIISLVCMSLNLFGQDRKPTIVLMPESAWCVQNGYISSCEMQGQTVNQADYERALREDKDLVNVITMIGELLAERGCSVENVAASFCSINQNPAEDQMTASSHSDASSFGTSLGDLIDRAKPDILVGLSWEIKKIGPRNAVTYSLRGMDTYTNEIVAVAQEIGRPFFSAGVPALVKQAAMEQMDGFAAQLKSHFDDLLTNGREISLVIKMVSDSGRTLEDKCGDDGLFEIIEDWVDQNTVNHEYYIVSATESAMHFRRIRIPIYRSDGTPVDSRHFVAELSEYLSKMPCQIKSKIETEGLGYAVLFIE